MSKKPFKRAWWLSNPHLQTIWPVIFRRRPVEGLVLERERLELPDGDFIDLDWMHNANAKKNAPLVLMLHGVEGSIESHYAKGMLKQFERCGWRGVFMHFRGCSGEPNRLPRDYHSGETGDVEYVTQVLCEREPGIELAAVGVYLGGNVLLKWLGETKANNPLKAAVAISVPFELHKAAMRIQEGFSRFYQWYFVRCLRERITLKVQSRRILPDPDVINRITTMYDYDDHITAILHGFSGVDEYYRIASSRQYLLHIKVPTLILHAKDDPFMTEDVIPCASELSPFIKLEVSESGGHVGFVGGKYPWKPEYWLQHRVPPFLQEHLK